ncbi:MAG: undecaprenyl-diphosphate phosphatase [Armatimonadota bacterium]|nr:undecaprenyl-diphosphate phosphatase [Armatimonadota bacterium]
MRDLVVLGLVQGLTEFLPVSSSAHLLFVEHYLGIPRPGLVLEAVLHLGTAAAAIFMFWPDVSRLVRALPEVIARPAVVFRGQSTPDGRMAAVIVVATVLTGALGLAFAGPLERTFLSVRGTAYQLMVTGLILLASRERGHRAAGEATLRDGVVMGLAQAAAIIPGISRSGATIVAGIGSGLRRTEAARLSFLMAIPAILGAGAFAMKDAGEAAQVGYAPLHLLVGAVTAAIFGALAIRWLLEIVRRGRLLYMSVYCWAVGLVVLATVR